MIIFIMQRKTINHYGYLTFMAKQIGDNWRTLKYFYVTFMTRASDVHVL